MASTGHIISEPPFRVGPISRSLARAALAALHAPSILNTQPWHWHIDHDTASLRADRRRQLATIDPDGRLLTISGGAALHHARTALEAGGASAEVARFPRDDDPDLLAVLRYRGTTRPTGQVERMCRAIASRCTDRRPFAGVGVPEEMLDRLRLAAQEAGARLHITRPQDLTSLAVAAGHAAAAQLADPAYRAELSDWARLDDSGGDGLPLGTIAPAGARPVPLRDFTGTGYGPSIYSGIDLDDRHARYAIVVTDADGPYDWLTAGEALSAVLLTATADGLATSTMSDLVENVPARRLVRHMLGDVGHPAIGVRVGVPAPGEPPRTRRRPAVEMIEVVADPA
ncbi:nitroreductase [Dactylosporangium roseum]|uniref:Nitroreductase n=1 Tax=Dactylosporangium roseum TaxID=47989 RepID=A0ABY5ZGK1_9ACTN|nr:nitroreductase [Dactylosporangium roseum]UWZ40078.1 nitroreductase [Dactylosporangium roseum]